VQLVMVLRQTQGMFALMPVRSNFSVPARDALLQRLENDLSPIPLHSVRLARETSSDAAHLIARAAAELPGSGVVVLLGLEETQGIVPIPGEPQRRPPALAALNHGREALRRHCPHPLIVWCDPLTFLVLRDHAPDFFDHFTGLFTFHDARPETAPVETPPAVRAESTPAPRVERRLDAGSRVALSFYEEQVERLKEPTPERARALLGLADALLSLHDAYVTARLARAEAAAREALALLPPEDNAAEWPRGQKTLGDIFSDQVKGDRAENLRRAIAYYEAALRVWTEADFPQDWAMTQNNLGVAYRNLPTGDRAENLRRAIACYEAALRVWTEADFPQDWAMTQNNLGIAYSDLPMGDRGENLRRAIACYEAALRVWTEADFPQQWATTQNNLGIAYSDLPMGDRGENLRRAIACYEAALRVWTEADFPQQWATTQNNLGTACLRLPTGDRGENLRRAIACFEVALRVRTEANFPKQWATTQFNLGLALREVEESVAARECFVAAERGFASVGLDDHANNATRMMAKIDAELEEDQMP
jgi:tetratricopeptide (TPR) repeat protein